MRFGRSENQGWRASQARTDLWSGGGANFRARLTPRMGSPRSRLFRLAIVLAAIWWLGAFYIFDMKSYLIWLWECRENQGQVVACIVSYIPLLSLNPRVTFFLATWRFDILAAPFYVAALFCAFRWVLRGGRTPL